MPILILFVVLAIAVLGGYIMNIVNIISYEVLVATPLFIVQVIGIFIPPLGAIMGWVV